MNIEKSLKDYKKNKGKIEIINQRCSKWQECLDTMTDEEIASEFIYESTDTYGMPKSKNNNSPVENRVIKNEVTREMVKNWIKEERSRLAILEYELKQVDIALGSLTEEENFIITCKCIDNWNWMQIEIEFNKQFRNRREITYEQLKKIKKEALKKMKEIINT